MGTMRVISGRFKGFSFDTPKTGTRPTTDRVKEALFSHLEFADAVEDARVLDLFAGTGALSFEALSRGAVSATLVDAAPAAIALLKRASQRLTKLGSWDPSLHVEVRRAKAQAFVRHMEEGADYSLVFLDPPYDFSEEDFNALLVALADSGALSEKAMMVTERSSRSAAPVPPEGWEIEQSRNYGETAIEYLVRS